MRFRWAEFIKLSLVCTMAFYYLPASYFSQPNFEEHKNFYMLQLTHEVRLGLSNVVTRWFQGHFQVMAKCHSVSFLLKTFYKLGKYWFSIYIIYLVGENTFYYDTESGWFSGQRLLENCLLVVVISSLFFDNIVPQLGHYLSNRITSGSELAPKQQGARAYSPQVL